MIINGSHDSSAYTFNFNVSFWNSGKWKWLQQTAKFCKIAKQRITRMSQTQDKTIYEQLESGIRALDIRLSENGGVFYSSHTFATILFVEVIDQIKRFQYTHPGDEIYVIIRRDFSSGKSVNDQLFIKLVESSSLDFTTLKCYYNGNCSTAKFIRAITNVNVIWFNAQTIAEYNNREINLLPGKVNCLMAVLTPKLSFDTIFTGSIKRSNIGMDKEYSDDSNDILIVFRDFV